jgi:hypothetical protein
VIFDDSDPTRDKVMREDQSKERSAIPVRMSEEEVFRYNFTPFGIRIGDSGRSRIRPLPHPIIVNAMNPPHHELGDQIVTRIRKFL